jgi:S-adenosylmethionine-diacylgycerolhomoserine-N-methlytransferase
VERTGLADRVTLVHGLAENLSPSDFGLGSFDHALFSYSLSMIPDWRQAIISASKALSAKGHIHVVDFGDLKTLPGKALLQRWLALFHVTPRGELLNALEALFAHRNKALTLLPGRYAFRLSTTKANIASLSCCIADTGRG